MAPMPDPHAGDAFATRAVHAGAEPDEPTGAVSPPIYQTSTYAQDGVIVIPKTGKHERLKENLKALDHPLTSAQLSELDRLFPPPSGPRPLEML